MSADHKISTMDSPNIFMTSVQMDFEIVLIRKKKKRKRTKTVKSSIPTRDCERPINFEPNESACSLLKVDKKFVLR